MFKQVELFFIPGIDNPADMFTKNLRHIKFEQYRSQLGLEFPNLTFPQGTHDWLYIVCVYIHSRILDKGECWTK